VPLALLVVWLAGLLWLPEVLLTVAEACVTVPPLLKQLLAAGQKLRPRLPMPGPHLQTKPRLLMPGPQQCVK